MELNDTKDEVMLAIIEEIRKLLHGERIYTKRSRLSERTRREWEEVMGFKIDIEVVPYYNKENVSGYYVEISAQGRKVAHFCIEYNPKNVIFPAKNIITYYPDFGLNFKIVASLVNLAFESPQIARKALRTEHFDALLAC